MLFSHRKNLKALVAEIQTETVSIETRNGLWNAFTTAIWDFAKPGRHSHPFQDEAICALVKTLWHEYFRKTLDDVPSTEETYDFLKAHFFDSDWYVAYDFIEFVAKNYQVAKTSYNTYNYERDSRVRIDLFVNICNAVLERENAAYRFVNKEVTQITSKEEIASIETASTSRFHSTNTHIQRSLSLLSDKKDPDFRNSIKESISAVEATCNALLGHQKNSLGDAIKELERLNIVNLHQAERRAFSALYGYTSDSGGIRHALLEESNLDFDDAKFMLVSCSAFCNYLISKAKDK